MMNVKEYLTQPQPYHGRLNKFDRVTERFIKQLGFETEEVKNIKLLNSDGINILEDSNKKAFTPSEILKYRDLERNPLVYEIKRIVDLDINFVDKKEIVGNGKMPIHINVDGTYEFRFIRVKIIINLE